MAARTRGFAHRIDIAAPQAQVWAALCGPTLLPLWLGPDAKIRPQRGGTLVVTVAPGLMRETMIDVFEAPRRLRLIYLPPPELAGTDGTVVEDILLDSEGDTTVLSLLCSGVPETAAWNPHFMKVRAVSERTLSRLKALVEKREQLAGSVG